MLLPLGCDFGEVLTAEGSESTVRNSPVAPAQHGLSSLGSVPALQLLLDESWRQNPTDKVLKHPPHPFLVLSFHFQSCSFCLTGIL